MRFILRWTINAVALFAAITILKIDYQGGLIGFVWLGLIFGLVNAVLRPVIKVLSCPLIILTLGLFTLIINTLMFYLAGILGQPFGIGFSVTGFWQAFLGALIVSAISIVLSLILRDELKGRRRHKK